MVSVITLYILVTLLGVILFNLIIEKIINVLSAKEIEKWRKVN